ncbi:hypothetical protein [Rhodococcus sp. ACS1]|nr:hypothetical protein [Rhodococcus sp. ACS1]
MIALEALRHGNPAGHRHCPTRNRRKHDFAVDRVTPEWAAPTMRST